MAGIAQLVEQRIRNAKVVGSIPISGTNINKGNIMTVKRQIHARCDMNVAAGQVWARISDHENTPSWVKEVKKVRLAKIGSPKNGVGAERITVFRPILWSTIHERITFFDEPHEFHTVLFKGMPGVVSHLTKFIVDDLGVDRCRLRWEVDFEFVSFHPFALTDSFSRQFKLVLDTALLNLKEQVEQSGSAQRI
jgi:hypothetical protein